jgi:hypothetical protein
MDQAHPCPALGLSTVTLGGPTRARLGRRVCWLVAAAGLLAASGGPADAQEPPCRFLCSPGFNIEPTITVEPLFGRPRIVGESGVPERTPRETFFEMVFALDVPTRAPRLGLTFEAIVAPFGTTDVNPFTGQSASRLGGDVRDNLVQIESEFNFIWLTADQTGNWVESHFDLVDQFSPARQPNDRSAYTHKLNFELDTSVAIFRWLPERSWLRRVELEGSLDYIATGLPRAGDEVPIGGERFVDDHSPWSFSFVFVIPVINPR